MDDAVDQHASFTLKMIKSPSSTAWSALIVVSENFPIPQYQTKRE